MIKIFQKILLLVLLSIVVGLSTGAQRFRGVDTATGKPIIVFYHYTSGDSLIVDSLAYFDKGVYVNGPIETKDSVKIGTFEGTTFRDLNIKQTDNVGSYPSAIRIEETSGTEAYELGVDASGNLIFSDDDGTVSMIIWDGTNLFEINDSLHVGKTSRFTGDAKFESNVEIEGWFYGIDSVDNVSSAELGYIDGLTSSAQDQITANTTEAEAGAIAGDTADVVRSEVSAEVGDSLVEVRSLIASNTTEAEVGAIAGDTADVVRSEVSAEVGDSLVEVYSLISSNTTEAEAGAIAGDTANTIRGEIATYTTEAEAGAIAGDTATVLRVELQQRILAIPDDSSWAGDAISRTAGTNLVFGNSVYVGADGKLEKTDADAAATSQAIYMVLETIAENSAGLMLWQGLVRADDWTWDEGPVYVSLTTGEYTQTPISADGDQLVKVGIAISATVIQYRAGWTIIEHK